MADDQAGGLAKSILELGEERLHDLVGVLLANERFVTAMQGAVTTSLSAKRSVDKNVTRLLALANVPTLQDLDEVREKLNELEDLLGDIHDRIRRLDQRPAEPAPTQTKRKKKRSEG